MRDRQRWENEVGQTKMFSSRTGWNREESVLAQAAAARRAQGLPVLDLTASNPTRCGFVFDEQALLAPLASSASLVYEPLPFGRAPARGAVAAYYAGHGALLDPAHLCLATSTSEAYSFLLRLLCDPGDEVLIASPSYPLFEYLAALNDVRLVPYPLFYDHGWQMEPQAVEERITARTRAIAVVHPNNPTGHFVPEAERTELEALCVRHNLALIVDEVFLDFPWQPVPPAAQAPRSFAAGPHPALTFVLSGISKVAALPQMKLSWLAILGPEPAREEARARLEVIADTFLSVSAPVQAALPAWLRAAPSIQAKIRSRIAENLAGLDALLTGTAVSRLAGEGGWYAVLRVPALSADEDFALALLHAAGVLVHPGSAFGFGPQGWMALSLLPEEPVFRRGIERLLQHVRQL